MAQLLDRWVAARNANDAEGMRSLFDEHMDQVRMTTGEVISTSASGTVKWFADSFMKDGKGTSARITTRKVRVLSTDAGVIDFTFALHRPDGSVTTNTTVAYFCVKRAGKWAVAALRFASVAARASK